MKVIEKYLRNDLGRRHTNGIYPKKGDSRCNFFGVTDGGKI